MTWRSDTERLDFMIENRASFGETTHSTIDFDTGDVVVSEHKTFVRVPCRFLMEWHCFDGETPRDAIDAAMDGPRCVGTLGDCTSGARYVHIDAGGPRFRTAYDQAKEGE